MSFNTKTSRIGKSVLLVQQGIKIPRNIAKNVRKRWLWLVRGKQRQLLRCGLSPVSPAALHQPSLISTLPSATCMTVSLLPSHEHIHTIHVWKPNHQCDGISRLGSLKVIRS